MIKAIVYVIKEHSNNIKRIAIMSFEHTKKQTIRTSLGFWWTVIRDIVYIFCLVGFRYLISGNKEVEGMHFVVYLILGLIPWFFMNEVINGAVNAYQMNSPIVKGIPFPITTLSTIEVTAIFLRRSFTILFCFIVLAIFEDLSHINYLLLLFYFIVMYVLMVAYNFVFSAFVAISKDFSQLYSTITRVLMFFLPILWSFERVQDNAIISNALKLLPFSYIITGFRQAFMASSPPTLLHNIFFWSVFIALFIGGCRIQYKFRKHYADFM